MFFSKIWKGGLFFSLDYLVVLFLSGEKDVSS